VIVLMEAECCALAGTDCRPTPLRRRAGRPQLKRDPLGSGDVPLILPSARTCPLTVPCQHGRSGSLAHPASQVSRSRVCLSLKWSGIRRFCRVLPRSPECLARSAGRTRLLTLCWALSPSVGSFSDAGAGSSVGLFYDGALPRLLRCRCLTSA